MNEKPVVTVALSGGVDSSVTAALLMDEGYSVRGMMLNLWNGDPDKEASKSKHEASIARANDVCLRLGIPFEVVDATNEFKKSVVDYFIASHRIGHTPNPCFVCNKFIKWGLLLELAQKKGSDYLATGHYARVIRQTDGTVELHKGLDPLKDQSYVLAGLTQEQLSKAILPLGVMTKVEVREIARRYNLQNFNQEDSQDLCFLGELDQEEFLDLYEPNLKVSGEIQDLKGELIGIHTGLSDYTIGQRKGLGSGKSEPIYVIRKDIEKNLLIVGTKLELGSKRISISDVNWIRGEAPGLPSRYSIKIRYKATPIFGNLVSSSLGDYDIIFDEKIRDATPGQFAVLYDGDNVIGSGVIKNVYGREQ